MVRILFFFRAILCDVTTLMLATFYNTMYTHNKKNIYLEKPPPIKNFLLQRVVQKEKSYKNRATEKFTTT